MVGNTNVFDFVVPLGPSKSKAEWAISALRKAEAGLDFRQIRYACAMADSRPLDPGPSTHLLPFSLEESVTIDSIQFVGQTPWGVPGALAVPGRRKSDGKAVLLINYEAPMEIFHTRDPISKEQEERLLLERLRTNDLRRGMGSLPRVRRGMDPPDFVVEAPDGTRGVDFTRFAIGRRMQSQALMRRLRRELLNRPREEYAHLMGAWIYLWFDDNGFSSLPQSGDDEVEALIAALRDYRFDPGLLTDRSGDGELPEELGDIGEASSGRGARFVAMPMRGGAPSSLFFLAIGFELGLAFQTDHDVSSAWGDIRRLVRSHDKPEIQSLVISVGAPDRWGLAYPSELALMEFALECDAPELSPEHLAAINVHFWGTGTVIQIHPTVRSLSGPLYAAFVPAHFSTAPMQVC